MKRTIIAFIAFDETPSINVNDLAPEAIITTEHVKATDPLSKPFADLVCPRFFLLV